MSELNNKLHYKLDGTIDEITLYSTEGEAGNNPATFGMNGVKCYAATGASSDSNSSRMNYKDSNGARKILKQANESVLLNLLGYRNNEELLQALPVTRVTKGSYVYFNNENAPTISGYDFVCSLPNCFYANEDMTVRLYYVPQNVADRTKTKWDSYGISATGDLSKSDYFNTFSATSMSYLFRDAKITKPPHFNSSKNLKAYMMFGGCNKLTGSIDFRWLDTTNWSGTNCQAVFQSCSLVEELDLSTWNLKKVSVFQAWFMGCSNLKTIKIDGWDTSNAYHFQNMFASCPKLETITGALDMSSAQNSYIYGMFSGCTNLRNVHLKNVPKNLILSRMDGTEGVTYIIDNYI